MNAENKQFLDDNRHFYDVYVRAQYVAHLDAAKRQRLLEVVQQEFSPGYHADLWCSTCVVDLLVFAYRMYDEWLKKQN